MPKRCSQEQFECPIVCDFCRMYNFNGDEEGVYWGLGYCIYHEREMDVSGGCDDFICMNYKRIEPEDVQKVAKEKYGDT